MPSLQTNGRKPRGEGTFSVNLFKEVKRGNITSRIVRLYQRHSLFQGKRKPLSAALCPFSAIQADGVGRCPFHLEGQKRRSPPLPRKCTVSRICQNTFAGKASDFLIPFPVLLCRDFKLLALKLSFYRPFAFVYCHLVLAVFVKMPSIFQAWMPINQNALLL